jgi:DNA-binding IclR family transcriptional regulator
LSELARRTGMHKPTALRLARTLAAARFLVKREDGAWRLGPAAGWIGSRYQAPLGFQQHIRSGEVFPLDRGSAGRVIQAALGEPGDLYERIRRRGFHITRGERSSRIASVSAAVRGLHGTVLGSVSTSGPVERLTAAVLRRHAEHTVAAARLLGEVLGGMPAGALRATWHP